MATIRAFVRCNEQEKLVNMRFRLYQGAKIQLFYTSDILLQCNFFDNKKECCKRNVDCFERQRIEHAVQKMKDLIINAYRMLVDEGEEKTSKTLSLYVDKLLNATDPAMESKKDFFAVYDEFIAFQQNTVSKSALKGYNKVKRALQRFENYQQLTYKRNFSLDLESINEHTLTSFENYILLEPRIIDQYPQIKEMTLRFYYKERSQNYVANLFHIIRHFFNWCNQTNNTSNKPFLNFKVKAEIYGTPFYLTLEERERLYAYDFKEREWLTEQKDIFVFQCCIGCRVSDLLKLTKSNVIDGAIEYIATKTKDSKPHTIRVPLNSIALEIIDKYAEKQQDTEKLLPFTVSANYNRNLKAIFKEAGLNRLVTLLNPLTRKEEQKPLYEVATSHLARRTFIGNLYKRVQDPNLIASLSGHVEGSKAFARYRSIDEEMKRKLVKMLE